MPSPDDLVKLRHMLDAARKAVQITKGLSRRVLDEDEIIALALVRLLEIVGEAATRISPALKNEVPAVPWQQIAATRRRLIHGYYDVDLDIVWSIVTSDLPPLILDLEKVIPR